jgi:hypothetical protein
MPIKLVSKSRRPQTFNLMCLHTRVRRDTFEYDPGSGQRHTKRGYVRMPASITLAAKGRPGDRTQLLPDAAAQEDEIEAAERKGFIRIIQVSSDEAEAEKAAERHKAAKAARRVQAKSPNKTTGSRKAATSKSPKPPAGAPTETKTETRGHGDD